MSLSGLGEAFDFASKIVDKLFPDPGQKSAAQLELLKLTQSGELAQLQADTSLALAQSDVNKVEAASGSLFVSGWRPAIGWCCAAIFLSNYIGVPLLAWLSPLMSIPPPPRLDIGEVLPVLLGMLGLGALRTNEKIKGVA